jgi:hypothetical protein
MANTYVDYTATAGQTDFAFSFPFLEDSHVVVEVEGVATSAFSLVTTPSTKVVLNSGTTSGQIVRVRRNSNPTVNLVDFEDGSVLTENELDLAYRHNRYLNEEAFEGNTSSLQVLEGTTNFNANFNKIVNLAPPTASLDAANKDYVDDKLVLSGTSLSGFNKSTHTGDGTSDQFNLSFTPQTGTAAAFRVAIDGVLQTPDDAYTINTGTNQITFTSAPPTNAEIVVIATGTAQDVNSIGVTATGSTTARSLSDRFADVVSVLDYIDSSQHAFIASNDTASQTASLVTTGIKQAIVSNRTVFVPNGTYLVSSEIKNDVGGFKLLGESPVGGYKTNAGNKGAIIKAESGFSDTTVVRLRSNTGQPCQINNIIIDAANQNTTCLSIDGDTTTYESISNAVEDVVCLNGTIGVSFGDKNYVNNLYRINCRSCTTAFSFAHVDNNALNISDCVISDATTGFSIDAGTQINITGGTFEDTAVLFDINHTSGSSVNNVIVVRDCYIEDITTSIWNDDNQTVGVNFSFENNQVVLNDNITGPHIFNFNHPNFLSIRNNQFKGAANTTGFQNIFRLDHANLAGRIENNLFGVTGSINRFNVSTTPTSAGFYYENTNVSGTRFSNLTLGDGNGISFSPTSDGSGTSSSELLDDYEEGTFTPTIAGTSTAGSNSYSVQTGFYTKIGNRVLFNIDVAMSAKDGTIAGNLKIAGLPYTPNSTSNNNSSVAIGRFDSINLTSGYSSLNAMIQSNGNLLVRESGDNVAALTVDVTNISASTRLTLAGHYSV